VPHSGHSEAARKRRLATAAGKAAGEAGLPLLACPFPDLRRGAETLIYNRAYRMAWRAGWHSAAAARPALTRARAAAGSSGQPARARPR
jgi:hypothetical protein